MYLKCDVHYVNGLKSTPSGVFGSQNDEFPPLLSAREKPVKSSSRRITPTPVKAIKKEWTSLAFKEAFRESDSLVSSKSWLTSRKDSSHLIKERPSKKTDTLLANNVLKTIPSSELISELQSMSMNQKDDIEAIMKEYQSRQNDNQRMIYMAKVFYNAAFCWSYGSIIDPCEMILRLLISLSRKDHHRIIVKDNLFPEIVALYYFACYVIAQLDFDDVWMLLGEIPFQRLTESTM
jgi:hypothetical protein